MASRVSFHAQLSSIMETMARSTLVQVCKLVDEDSTELQLQLSRLLLANSALKEKVNSLECELTSVTSDDPKLCRSYRSVGVQTVRCRNEDTRESQSPTIEGVFGNDWCMNLWKDRDPYSVERYTDCQPRPPDKAATLSAFITVTEFKEEDFMEDVASGCQQEMPQQQVQQDIMAAEHEPPSVDYLIDGSNCSLPFDQEQLVSAGGLQDPSVQLVSISDTEEGFSTHIIPIEEDEDGDEEEEDGGDEEEEDGGDEEEEEEEDVQFVQESQQESPVNTAGEPSHDDQQMLQTDNTGTYSLEEYSQRDLNIQDEQCSTKTDVQNTHKFTCQICNRSFFHKGTLTRHMKSHRSTFCSICKQNFPRKGKQNSHSCVAPVPSQRIRKSCVLCGKIFANPSALRIHYVVHTGEKPHTCTLCGKGFTQKGNLKCHLRIHTGERPFHCGKCGKTFTQKVNLNHHIKAHKHREFVGDKLLRTFTDGT